MRADLAVVSYWSLLYIEDKDDEIFLMPSSPSLSRHIVVKVRVGSEKGKYVRINLSLILIFLTNKIVSGIHAHTWEQSYDLFNNFISIE